MVAIATGEVSEITKKTVSLIKIQDSVKTYHEIQNLQTKVTNHLNMDTVTSTVNDKTFIAGSLKHYLNHWHYINTPTTVYNWINNGVDLQFTSTPTPFEMNNHMLTYKQSQFVDQEISELLKIGAIEICKKRPKFISSIGCVPKKGGKLRMIVDLRELNKHILAPKFCNEDIRTAFNLIKSSDKLITVDIKSCFHHIPIDDRFKDFISLKWKGIYYRWCVIPFRLNVSPFFCVKTMRPVISYLRSQGLRVMVYIDDFILVARPEEME